MTVSSQGGTYNNLIEMLDNSRNLYSKRPLFGTKHDGNYEWTSYEQFAEKVDDLRGGLASLGISSGDKVAIISKNTEEWAVSAYATYGLCGQHIPMYETQLAKEWEYIVKDCSAKVLLVSNPTILQQTLNFPERIDSLENVVLISGSSSKEVKTYDNLLKIGRENPVEAQQPESDSPMGMIYTSLFVGSVRCV